MKLKSLYDVLGLKFQDKFLDVVLCENPRLQYAEARDILKNHNQPFDYKDSDLTIYTSDRNNITTVLKFMDGRNCTSLRGATIRNLYVDKDIKDLSEAKACIYPCAKRIIEKD